MSGAGCGSGGRAASASSGEGIEGKESAPTAAEGRKRGGALATLSAICAYDPRVFAIVDTPELTAVSTTLMDCSSADDHDGLCHVALLTAGGEVLCLRNNGEDYPQNLVPARLPWPAAAVSCGHCFTVALRRGGAAVYSWGAADAGRLGHGDVGPRRSRRLASAEVQGLPEGDPVVLLEAGANFTIAVTQSGEAYGWGPDLCRRLAPVRVTGDAVEAPTRLAALSGRGLKRIACGSDMAVAETNGAELLGWGRITGMVRPLPLPLRPRAGRVAFPLRSLAAAVSAGAAADARGRLWCLWKDMGALVGAGLPAGERVVRVAGCFAAMGINVETHFVALTADSHLWDCNRMTPCRSITAAHPMLPRGLLPCGGGYARRIVLIPEPSCGQRRCALLFLAAGRLGLLPGGQMRRAALAPFLIDNDWLFDHQWGAAAGAVEDPEDG